MIDYVAYSSKGKNKKTNEDRILVNNAIICNGQIEGHKEDLLLAAVFDGVGSTLKGGLAAETVARRLLRFDLKRTSALTVSRHLYESNRRIVDGDTLEKTNMATTVTGIILTNTCYLIFNVGLLRVF